MNYDEIKNAWNAQADDGNKWHNSLSVPEKIEWAAIHAAAKERTARQAAQAEVVALKERIARASTEQPSKNPTLVQIDWRDPASDWPWFWLLGTHGEWLHLQGADYPDGSAKHDGDCFWVHKSDVQTMRSNISKQAIRARH